MFQQPAELTITRALLVIEQSAEARRRRITPAMRAAVHQRSAHFRFPEPAVRRYRYVIVPGMPADGSF
jgi:hypothetical protein